MTDHSAFHEIWWIYSPERHEWGGLRIAHFRKTFDGSTIVYIMGEDKVARIGPRVWDDIAPREGWVKIEQIVAPSPAKIEAAIDTAMFAIAERITREAGFDK